MESEAKKLKSKIRRPSLVGLLLAQHTSLVVIPHGPHKADELQALLDWYIYRSYFNIWFTSVEAAERHFERWLKGQRKDG